MDTVYFMFNVCISIRNKSCQCLFACILNEWNYLEKMNARFVKQGPDLRDLRRPLEGVIFWDLWLNWTHFGSLTEDNPDFFKQMFRGRFGLHLVSEAESDLTTGFFMASNSSIPTFR